jgi:Cytidylyltransferase-like
MDADLRATLENIHASPYQLVIVCAGGGGRAIEQLLALPGSSRTVLEAVIPYGRPAFVAFLGHEPVQFSTADVSRALAERAYERACRWAEPEARPLGVACTATLATTQPKRGAHRAFVTVRDERAVVTHTLVLAKGARDRLGEEHVVSTLLLAAVAEACRGSEGAREREGGIPGDDRLPHDAVGHSLPPSLPLSPALLPEESIATERCDVASPLGQLLAGKVGAVLVLPDGMMRAKFPAPAAVFPGAFNPLHAGHLGLASAAARRLGLPVTFEISATNVDKPALTEAELRRRLGQFFMRAPLLASDAPTFVRKARLFPGCAFVIGADTLERLFAPRYYGGADAMVAALAEIQAAGCRFLVAGRHVAGTYRAAHEIAIPPPFRAMFDFIPEGDFRVDLSSTQLRG